MAIQSIQVIPRRQAVVLTPDPRVAVISISCPGNPAPLPQGLGPVLRIEADDVAGPVLAKASGRDLVAFSRDHARVIIDWVEALHQESDEVHLIVHCDAGLSRSPAVGLFIAEHLGLPLPGRFPFANRRVMKMLKQEAGTDYVPYFGGQS